MPAGHVAGSLPAGLAPCSPSRMLAMARPVAWAGKKQARMAPTPSCSCAQLTSRGPALNSSRMTGCPAASGEGFHHEHTVGAALGLGGGRVPCPLPTDHVQRPTCTHSILQQLQLVSRQGQVLAVPRLHLHIYPCVQEAEGHRAAPRPHIPHTTASIPSAPTYPSPGTPAPHQLPAPHPPPHPLSNPGTAAPGSPQQS